MIVTNRWLKDLSRQFAVRLTALAFAGFLALSSLSAQQSPSPLLNWMNQIAQQELQHRKQAIDEIHTVAQANRRKQWVRKTLLQDLGGLPDYSGPLHARITGRIQNSSYTIEKVLYQSLPGFYVTANVYRPNGPGPYPAVLLQSGHTQEGKPENQRIAANLAMKGFVVLCFDPIGQGEREQTYSRMLGAPLAGWSVPEHTMAGAQARLINEGVARYFIWDAKRSLDYLVSRPDVDTSRLGAEGCSGGGALTTFIGALDPRLKVVIPACFPSSWQPMFSTGGPDSDMTFPRFLVSGLDTADFVELSAPTPWLLQATKHDQYNFTPAGVRMVYEEARKFYGLYGAENKVGFLLGPGSHGMPLVSREAVYKWMIRYLKNGQGDFHELPVKHMYTAQELQVTVTGHVDDLPESRKLYQLFLADFDAKRRPESIPKLRVELGRLRIPTDGSSPKVKVLNEQSDPAGQREDIEFESEPGIWLRGTLLVPSSAGRKPAVLMVEGGKINEVMPVADMAEQMARMGLVVLEMEPRHSPGEIGHEHEGPYTGDWMTNTRAGLIGRDMAAMRAHDILRGVDLLAARSDVDRSSIRAAARGVKGVWLLLAAASDPRIKKIWLDHTPYSLRLALESPIGTDLWDAVIPGFVLHWDFNDLVKAMGSRPVMWTDPTNWMGRVVALGPPFQYRYVLGDITDFANVQDDAYIREFLK
ncbi:MAG: alpha/beta hydrolase family protein [Terriglobia bacterium]